MNAISLKIVQQDIFSKLILNILMNYLVSDYCKKIADEYGIKVGDVMKLIPDLGDKTNYVLHYRNLQLY